MQQLQDGESVQLIYRGARYTQKYAQHQTFQSSAESMQLIYRGACYMSKQPQHQTLQSMVALDHSLSNVQISRKFKCLLYRGHSYLIPHCYYFGNN
jgi:hypothetical protein